MKLSNLFKFILQIVKPLNVKYYKKDKAICEAPTTLS